MHFSNFTWSHPQMIYRSMDAFSKEEVCVETSPDYPSDWNIYYIDCECRELHVAIYTVKNNDSVHSLNYYFYFEERSFINVTATGGKVYYRGERDINRALDRFNGTDCHGNTGDYFNLNITENPLKIFDQEGYYHICFDVDHGPQSFSFEMTVTEFYYDIPTKSKPCADGNLDMKHKKCCRQPKLLLQPCVYFSPGNSISKGPATDLPLMQLHISHEKWLLAISGMLMVMAVPTVVVAAVCMHRQCKKWRKQQEQKPWS